MQLFRQPRDGDWGSVFGEVARQARDVTRCTFQTVPPSESARSRIPVDNMDEATEAGRYGHVPISARHIVKLLARIDAALGSPDLNRGFSSHRALPTGGANCLLPPSLSLDVCAPIPSRYVIT